MSFSTSDSGWSRIAPMLDVEVLHGVPVRVSKTVTSHHIEPQAVDENLISEKIHELTGLGVSVYDWTSISSNEQEWSVCIDKNEFEEVLHRLALSSAALFVDRFHKPIDRNAVDWDDAEYTLDFNHALQYCCIPWDTLKKSDYFDRYVTDMHRESLRLVDAGISPTVEAE